MKFINVSIVSTAEMKKLNRKYKGKSSPTDVLSFNLDQKLPDGNFLIGEVVVCESVAKKQAEEYDNSYQKEVAELVQHGVLHLLGVHHEGDI